MKTAPLTNSSLFALLDDADYERVAPFKWRIDRGGYARCVIPGNTPCGRVTVLMHRLVLDAPTGVHVDHANGNKLDNTRTNIRLCNHAQNSENMAARGGCSSRFKGVRRHCQTAGERWEARIRVNGVPHYLGLFADEIEAAKVYDAAAHKYFGEFARPNFPPTPTI